MANKFYIVPNVRTKSSVIKESSGTEFLCPTNTVMTGRWHKGDENGQTQYEYATLKAIDENGNDVSAKIEVTDIQWSAEIKESASSFRASNNRVIVGRWHKGDENGKTKYATAIVRANGVIAQTTSDLTSSNIKESSGIWFVTDADRVIVGRGHKGDENGYTWYISAKLLIDSSLKDPAPKGTRIVPYIRKNSATFKESNSDFICPSDTLITGRYHTGDENGSTIYEYASLKAIDSSGKMIMGIITIEDIRWENGPKESSGIGFTAEVNRVIVGRKHIGDENASSIYATGIVKFNGYPTFVSGYTISGIQKETSGWFKSSENQIITAQYHYGDENGYTFYGLGTIFCEKQIENKYPIDVIVALHKNETFNPMSASDFAILSRFRKHISGGTDEGYNKNTNAFESGNSQSLNFYNIPLSIINTYYSKVTNKRLYNYRPRDPMSLSGPGYFLQPFDHLHGVPKPNGIVPAYVNELTYTEPDGTIITFLDFWLFFGYNDVAIFAHEGDWEHLMVEIVNKKIIGAWLSSHTSLEYHPGGVFRTATELDIKMVNGRQQLTIYCSKGTHALYATANEASFPDDTTSNGYLWKITDNAPALSQQPWKLFAGAWGEVGERKESTGPLGPWYKRFDFWWEQQLSLSALINSSDVIIVPNQYFISSQKKESSELTFEAPENMVMAGRRHGGDENGMTTCLYASLKAINQRGQTVNGTIRLDNYKWTDWIKESNSNYTAPSGYVIVGRQHSGDENGQTRYKIARITFNGNSVTTVPANSMFEYQIYKESAGAFFKVEPYFLYIGRIHNGDENGTTENIQGLVKI